MKTKELIGNIRRADEMAEVKGDGSWPISRNCLQAIIRQLERLEAMREACQQMTKHGMHVPHYIQPILDLMHKALAQEEKE